MKTNKHEIKEAAEKLLELKRKNNNGKEKKDALLNLFRVCGWNSKKVYSATGRKNMELIQRWVSQTGISKEIEKNRIQMILNEAKTNHFASTISQLARELEINQTTLSAILKRHGKTPEAQKELNKKIFDRIMLEIKVNPNIDSFEALAKATGFTREALYYGRFRRIRNELKRTFAERRKNKPKIMLKKTRRI